MPFWGRFFGGFLGGEKRDCTQHRRGEKEASKIWRKIGEKTAKKSAERQKGEKSHCPIFQL